MFQFEYTKNAVRDLQKLDQAVAKRILKKIDFFSKQENPLKFAKKLTDSSLGEYRFRIGDYRIFFDTDEGGNLKVHTHSKNKSYMVELKDDRKVATISS